MIKQYIVDAFTDWVFAGNPAAVCLPKAWPDEATMMAIAKENNLSETAFAVREDQGWHLRWFTPAAEIDLCGHATLATGFVVLNFVQPQADRVVFRTLSGALTVSRTPEGYAMDFPAYQLHQVPVTDQMTAILGIRPLEAWMGRDLVCVLPDEAAVRDHTPATGAVCALEGLLVHTTAPGDDADMVTRSFAPKLGIEEDPVCGSGHCHTAVYWAHMLGKESLSAVQASPRGGRLHCTLRGDRLTLAGQAVLFEEGVLHV